MVRGDRRETSATDCSDCGALRLDTAARLVVVGGSDEMLFAGANLECERPLRRLGQHLIRLEAVSDLAGETKPIEAARGEHDCVEPALSALAQTRVDVAAKPFDRQ